MSNEEVIPGSYQDAHAAVATTVQPVVDQSNNPNNQEINKPVEVDERPQIAHVGYGLVVNLALTERDLFYGMDKEYKEVSTPKGVVNLFNPFKKEAKESELGVPGAARAAVKTSLELYKFQNTTFGRSIPSEWNLSSIIDRAF